MACCRKKLDFVAPFVVFNMAKRMVILVGFTLILKLGSLGKNRYPSTEIISNA